MESTRAMPSRFRKAPEAASEPASEAVCETVACRACSERPTFMAMIGFFSSRARAASRSKPATESKASMCRPSDETRSSSIRPSAISDRPVCAWLPAVIRKAIGRPRFCIVMLMAMLDDWVMMATPLPPSASRMPPCWSGHSSAPSA